MFTEKHFGNSSERWFSRMYILLFCSFYPLPFFWKGSFIQKLSRTKRAEFMTRIKRALKSGNIEREWTNLQGHLLPF